MINLKNAFFGFKNFLFETRLKVNQIFLNLTVFLETNLILFKQRKKQNPNGAINITNRISNLQRNRTKPKHKMTFYNLNHHQCN